MIHKAPTGVCDSAKARKLAPAIEQRLQSDPRSRLQDDKPGALVRRKSQDLTKIMAQGDKHTSYLGTDPVYGFVSLTLETLVAQAHHIVAGRSQKLDPASTQILI
jgi:hypothetical protein